MDHPRRIIIEITNHCNLDCTICLRRSWNDNLGKMSRETFTKFLADIREFTIPPTVLFGGYGEPLSHPGFLDFLHECKQAGADTTLITNGTLLNPGLMESLVQAGLDRLWISVDSAHRDAIQGSSCQKGNSQYLQGLDAALGLSPARAGLPELGLACVLTRNNTAELIDLVRQGQDVGVKYFHITSLEAYSDELALQTPYQLEQFRQPGAWRSSVSDLVGQLEKIAGKNGSVIDGPLLTSCRRCPFAERRDLVLRWDGELSPCLPLLYDRTVHIDSWAHHQRSFSLGNIQDRSILDIWSGREAFSLRERLLERDFSPCLHCRDCWLADDNLSDCMGFEHPACGGCLWAEGLIGCP